MRFPTGGQSVESIVARMLHVCSGQTAPGKVREVVGAVVLFKRLEITSKGLSFGITIFRCVLQK